MNAADVLRYGHLTLIGALEQAPKEIVTDSGACGVWSIKDIVAHLASYEIVLIDILQADLDGGPKPNLDRYRDPGSDFNDGEVGARASRSLDEVLGELNDCHARTLELAARFDTERFRQSGTIAWYGPDYSLDDLVVYMYYGHKREHAAQIEAFRDRQVPGQ